MCDNPYLFQFLNICLNDFSMVILSLRHILTLCLHRIIHSLKRRCNEEILLIFCLTTASQKLYSRGIFFSIVIRDILFIDFKTWSNLFEIHQCAALMHMCITLFYFHDNIELSFRSIRK